MHDRSRLGSGRIASHAYRRVRVARKDHPAIWLSSTFALYKPGSDRFAPLIYCGLSPRNTVTSPNRRCTVSRMRATYVRATLNGRRRHAQRCRPIRLRPFRSLAAADQCMFPRRLACATTCFTSGYALADRPGCRAARQASHTTTLQIVAADSRCKR